MLAHRYDVYTLPLLECYLPIILRHSGDDMLVCECPLLADTAVLDPQISVLLCDLKPHLGILLEDGRVGFARVVHDFSLVVDEILHSQGR